MQPLLKRRMSSAAHSDATVQFFFKLKLVALKFSHSFLASSSSFSAISSLVVGASRCEKVVVVVAVMDRGD